MKKVSLLVLMILALIASAFFVSKSRTFQFFGELVSKVETDSKVVALTFDDGPWGEKYADEVIEIMDGLNVKGTFFLNGKSIDKRPEVSKRLVHAGHDIGNHSYNHKYMVFMGLDEVKNEVDLTTKSIRGIGYGGDIYFRPPYGKKLFTLPYYLQKEGIITVLWDVEPESYDEAKVNPEAMAAHVVDHAKPGSIILLHALGSNNQVSRDSISLIVRDLRAKGFRFVTLTELFKENPHQGY